MTTENSVDFVLGKIIQLLNSDAPWIHLDKVQLQSVYEDMQLLRHFLSESEGKRSDDDKTTKDVKAKIRDVAWRVDDTIDLLSLRTDHHHLRRVMSKEIESIGHDGGICGGNSEPIDLKPALREIYEVLSLAPQRLAGTTRCVLDSAKKDIEFFKAQLMGIYGLLSSLPPDTAETIRISSDRAIEEIDSIKTQVETWLRSDDHLLPRLSQKENIIISAETEEVFESPSWPSYRFAVEFSSLSHRLSGLLKDVDFAYKIRQGYDSSIEDTKVTQAEMRIWMTLYTDSLFNLRHHSHALEEFRDGFRVGVIELETFRAGMKIYGKQSGQVRDLLGKTGMETYKNEPNLLLWNVFYETILCEMEFIKTKINIHKRYKPFLRHRILFVKTDDLFFRSSRKVIHLTEKIFLRFGGFLKAFKIEDKFLSSLHFLMASQFSFLFGLLELTEQIDYTWALLVKKIRRIKKEVEIYEEKLTLSWSGSKKAYDLLKLFYLAHIISGSFYIFVEMKKGYTIHNNRFEFLKDSFLIAQESCHLYKSYCIFELVEKIYGNFASFMDGAISIMKELVIYQKGQLESLTAERICYGFSRVMRDIESVKKEVIQIFRKMNMYDVQVQPVRKSSIGASPMDASSISDRETIVGFDDQKTMIMDFLTGEHRKQLKLIQIVGMPGLGKTTLAKNVYCDPLIVHYFYVCAWTYLSQVCQKRELLLRILCSAFQLGDKVYEMSNEKLEEELYKRLKGKRYLIVMDDIWNIGIWNELKRCFPDDNNGSRIMFTSRLEVIDVAKSHHLRFLNDDESWILLKQRAFGKESCPLELFEIGKKIAKKCRGLPLAIVVLSGLLAKNEKTLHWWTHVAQSVSSYIATDQEHYMDTLALSYNHLPHHLKPCFLYFGAFPEDYEIPVWRLIWLWIAEGFISQHQQKRLEEVAEDYLRDLIDRNLVLVSKKKSNGGIKTCHVHDLLHDLCLKKAQEENFLIQLRPYEQVSSSSRPSSLMTNKCRRICVQSDDYIPSSWLFHGFPVRSFLSFYQSLDHLFMLDVLFVFLPFKFLRVLDLSSVRIIAFPVEVTHLCHLRYLALRVGELDYLKLPVANLQNLETLVVDGEPRSFLVFDDFWKMANLRHLYAKQLIEIPSPPDDGCPFALDRLQTICKLDLRGLDGEILRRIPHLRKLKCSFMQLWGDSHIFPKLKFLLHLENLNVIYDGFQTCPRRFPNIVEFPPNLKSLTLLNFCLPWEEMSTLGRLPNLEILKLSYKAFKGPRWDTGEREFLKLKFLKFRGLDIRRWYASSIHFPNLQTLVLEDCKQLEEIPRDLGYISALETIELWYCSSGAVNSAKLIGNQQLSMGNDGLKILIHPYHYEVSESEDEEDAD